MAVDYFLKIDGDPGRVDGLQAQGRDPARVVQLGRDPDPAAHGFGGGGGAGKVQMQDFHLRHEGEQGLAPSCMLGLRRRASTYKEAVLTCRKAGKAQQEFLIFKFKDVIVTSYQTGGSTQSDLLVDQASLGFSTDPAGLPAAEGGRLARRGRQGGLGPQAEQAPLRSDTNEKAQLEQPSDDEKRGEGEALAVRVFDLEVRCGRGNHVGKPAAAPEVRQQHRRRAGRGPRGTPGPR